MTAFAEPNDGLVEAARRRVGAIFNGKWRLDTLLGVGGMAAVYAATHRNGHRVAIKVLHGHFSLDQDFCHKLQQEGYVANLIEHPGALRILDDDRAEDGSVFLVMELLLGEGLDARLKRKGWRLPAAEVLGIGFGVLDVLVTAHGRGIVHRDIKPDNIFVTRAGEIKVLDFGIARLLDLPQGMTRTRNGALFGTLGFMAPEQALGRTADIEPRTDVWAMGATMFTLLTGRLVHEAPTPNEQLVCSATRPAPPLASVMPDADPGMAQMIDRALAFNAADRWPSAEAMQIALQEVALHIGPGGIVLAPPRVSTEHDVDMVLQAAAVRSERWTQPSVALPAPAPALVLAPERAAAPALPWPAFGSIPFGPPASATMIALPRRRLPRLAAGAALATALAGGAFLHCSRQGALEASAPGTVWPAPAVDKRTQPAADDPTVGRSAPGPVPAPVPAQAVDPMPVPVATTALPALPPVLPVAADTGPQKLKKARRRSLRRLPQAVRQAPAETQSVADDDLWDRRH